MVLKIPPHIGVEAWVLWSSTRRTDILCNCAWRKMKKSKVKSQKCRLDCPFKFVLSRHCKKIYILTKFRTHRPRHCMFLSLSATVWIFVNTETSLILIHVCSVKCTFKIETYSCWLCNVKRLIMVAKLTEVLHKENSKHTAGQHKKTQKKA